MSTDQASSATEGKVIKIINARLLLQHELVENTYLWLRDGKIVDPQELFFNDHREPDQIIDAQNAIVVPGYLDLQINGAFGIDFADESVSVEEIEKNRDAVARGLLKYGCTSFCPTLVSSDSHVYHKVRVLKPGLRCSHGLCLGTDNRFCHCYCTPGVAPSS